MNTESIPKNVLPSIDDPVSIRRRNWRMFKDKAATIGMTLGGISVIGAVLLIFFYLFYVVYPLLVPADLEKRNQIAMPGSGQTLYLDVDEKSDIGARFTDQGKAIFFYTDSGKIFQEQSLPLEIEQPVGADSPSTSPSDTETEGNIGEGESVPPVSIEAEAPTPAVEPVSVTSFAVGTVGTKTFALGLSDGRSLVLKREYQVTYPDDVRTVTPSLEYPLDEKPIEIDEKGRALKLLAVESSDQASTVAALTEDLRLLVVSFKKEISFLDDSVTLTRQSSEIQLPEHEYLYLLMDREQRNVYLMDADGQISQYDINDKSDPVLLQRIRAVAEGKQITAANTLTGGISLIIGASDGSISQWFPVRDEQGKTPLTKIREFDYQSAAITVIAPEHRRKGFLAGDAEGNLGVYHATAHRNLAVRKISDHAIRHATVTPPANAMLAQDAQGNILVWDVHNEHPEVSWSALWGKVWYENYQEPDHIWQSSSATSDSEPKFSLMPLTFGTLKAAFYAMLISIPLGVLGAIYTAYFMSPRIRAYVKPGVEIMEALPTVILGFLAGLWLAPVVEENLPGVFAMLLILPVGIMLFTYIWYRLPRKYTRWMPDDWAAALLMPVVVILVWFAFSLSYPLEQWLFDGSMRNWMTTELGIDYDQRNSIIVGLTMGFAVIPTIFSITEDAVFSVPKHLTVGSLALGATPWQTMTRVVILTASPGIFSAIMIGMGRAVGETMIVLMATGNTPIMDWNIFEGMRTLSANIAVEMPESELNSTHYRLLFLSGLVLFLFTFLINTVAEVVRQRLRSRYASI